jgi:hypothetical protein
MNIIKKWYYLPACAGIIFLIFIFTSLADVVLAVFSMRFYSTAAFIVIFGVGGVFAAFFSFTKAVDFAGIKNEFTRWSSIVLIWIIALLFIFLFSVIEGGEYEAAFISFGITLALTTLLFMKGEVGF